MTIAFVPSRLANLEVFRDSELSELHLLAQASPLHGLLQDPAWREASAIDFAYTSSPVEGNTYSREDAIALLTAGTIAPGKRPQETQMLQNLRDAHALTVRGLACKWLYHFGDAAQRESTELTFVGIHKNKEHARRTLAVPFDPGLESVDGRSIDSIVAFDAAWIDDDSIRVAQSYERDAKTSSSFATLTRVERSIDQALAFWMNDIRPEGGQGNSYRPEKVLVNPAAWDGEKAHLIAALDLQNKEPA